MNDTNSASMTPREIVAELDRHIVGQHAAKRAVAIALRNRWRRAQLPEALRAREKASDRHPQEQWTFEGPLG